MLHSATKPALAVVLLAATLGLQGCDVPRIEGFMPGGRLGYGASLRIPSHSVPFWRQEPDYFQKFGHVDPTTHEVKFNSCENQNVPVTASAPGVAMTPEARRMTACNGRGVCTPWDRDNLEKPYFWCMCEEGWADPECGTKRPSQTVAFTFSLFLGFLGADQFYLGYWFLGTIKLIPFIVAGLLMLFDYYLLGMLVVSPWWIWDIVRIGSAQVQSYNFLVMPDLERWMFQVFTMLFLVLLGFALGTISIFYSVKAKRRQADETLLLGAKIF